jgi:Abnormal spindle-like microcephaly-assoc'd, ASPM-SPD-2-Hydin/Protein of unknown function (DUF1573)
MGSDACVLLVLAIIPLILLNGCVGMLGNKPASSVGSFSVSPLNLNFGSTVSGKKASQNVTVTNTSGAALTIQQTVFSNPQFSMSGMTLPVTLAPNQSTVFTLWLNATKAGTASGTMSMEGGAGTTPTVIALSGTVAPTPQAKLSLSSTSIQFGTVSVGSKGTSELILGNAGGADLTISLVSLAGTDFGIAGVTTPKTISAGQSITATATFVPNSTGSMTGGISIVSNDPTTPTTNITLSGTASDAPMAKLTANPTSTGFGNVVLGSSASQNIILTNTGNTVVHISGVATTGAGFSVSGASTPIVLNAAQATTLAVKFTPTTSGTSTGTLKVDSDAGGPSVIVNLTGSETQAGLSVSPATFNFGSVVDGQTKSQNFSLTNTGTADLTVTQITPIGSGYSVSGFNAPATIAAGKTATFSVLFAPTTGGSLSGSVSVSSSAPNSPNAVSLDGTGVAASATISASPTSLSFGTVSAGGTSSKSVTVTNSGNSNMTISSISVAAKDVTASGVTTPFTLAPGKNASVNLTFGPKTAETVTGNVSFMSSQGTSAVVPLTGSGVQAGITTNPSNVGFGNVSVGTPNSQTIQIGNSGTGVLTITQLSVSGSGFTSSSVNLPISLNPGATTTFNIQFSPQSSGNAAGAVSIVSNAPTSPTSLALTGAGVAATATISLSASSLSFGSVNTGSVVTQNITITDTGNANVTLSGISISGTGYTMSGAAAPVTLSPSQKLTIGVQFGPSAAGNDAGLLTIVSGATGSPANVTLSGKGVAPSQHAATLSWNPSTSTVSGYNIYRSAVSGSGYSRINSSLTGGLNYTDSSVQSGQTYYYVTTAVDDNGNESNNSNEVQAIVP